MSIIRLASKYDPASWRELHWQPSLQQVLDERYDALTLLNPPTCDHKFLDIKIVLIVVWEITVQRMNLLYAVCRLPKS